MVNEVVEQTDRSETDPTEAVGSGNRPQEQNVVDESEEDNYEDDDQEMEEENQDSSEQAANREVQQVNQI